MTRPFLSWCSTAALLVFLSAAALAQNITVSVNAANTGPTVDERIFGANSVIWDREAGSSQTIALLQQAGIRTIRIPGGSLSDVYHWRVNKSIDTSNGNQLNPWVWWSGMHNFANLITELNAQAFVTVNYGSGTPEEAAAWVAYANAATTSNVAIGRDAANYDWENAGKWAALRAASAKVTPDDDMNFLRVGQSTPYGLKHWEIGNECYGANWETDLNDKPHDPTTYAQRAKVYIQKMKAVDPTIKIGVVITAREDDYPNGYTRSVTNPRTNVSYTGWTPVVLATLREPPAVTPDMVIYHRYEQGPGGESDAALLQKGKTWADDAAAMRRMVNDYLGSDEGKKVEIVVTENNSVYERPGKQSTSLVNGLFLADSLANLMQTEISAFMWWAVRNGSPTTANNTIDGNFSSSLYGWRTYGDYGMISSPPDAQKPAPPGAATTFWDPHPTYYAFKLLSRFARGGDSVVQATSNSNLLSAFAVKTASGDLNLLVINKDPANSLTGSFTVNGFTPASSATVYSYGKPQDDAARTGSGSTDVASTTLSGTGTTFSASFGSYSMSVINLKAASTTPPTPPPTTPTTPSAPPSSGGGGGGGGAASPWFLAVLSLLVAARFVRRR